ncbi:YybH family protein [Oceanobacillus polygoni]|uniref:Ketosteroid isomerase-like protein n=1 Tax=Oceanobacillus polygoni TaxID=1235259 RepID=A0A9X0YWV8_9BACI|nr:nuclear transport factor 2 family protein [Oceanobacillus polygoni]MBP2078659.1 ketosteroid isomerase-like protein [Oceanobacillus polygoni]
MPYKRALQQYINATNTHDFSNVKDVLHEEVVYWFSDKTCTSVADIQAYFEHAWDTIKEELYAATNVQWISVDQQSATCIYIYTYEGYHHGKFVSGSGRATNVFKVDEDGQWKLVHEHLSSL